MQMPSTAQERAEDESPGRSACADVPRVCVRVCQRRMGPSRESSRAESSSGEGSLPLSQAESPWEVLRAKERHTWCFEPRLVYLTSFLLAGGSLY